MEIKDSIKDFIKNELVNDKEYANLGDDDPLIETGIIDSLGIMKLIGFLEDNLSIQVDDDDLNPENFATVETISSFVKGKIS